MGQRETRQGVSVRFAVPLLPFVRMYSRYLYVCVCYVYLYPDTQVYTYRKYVQVYTGRCFAGASHRVRSVKNQSQNWKPSKRLRNRSTRFNLCSSSLFFSLSLLFLPRTFNFLKLFYQQHTLSTFKLFLHVDAYYMQYISRSIQSIINYKFYE